MNLSWHNQWYILWQREDSNERFAMRKNNKQWRIQDFPDAWLTTSEIGAPTYYLAIFFRTFCRKWRKSDRVRRGWEGLRVPSTPPWIHQRVNYIRTYVFILGWRDRRILQMVLLMVLYFNMEVHTSTIQIWERGEALFVWQFLHQEVNKLTMVFSGACLRNWALSSFNRTFTYNSIIIQNVGKGHFHFLFRSVSIHL